MTREQFIRQIEREQGPLRRFLCVLCGGDAQRADDIAQEALLKAYLHYQDFSGRSHLSRARSRLRRILDDNGELL